MRSKAFLLYSYLNPEYQQLGPEYKLRFLAITWCQVLLLDEYMSGAFIYIALNEVNTNVSRHALIVSLVFTKVVRIYLV